MRTGTDNTEACIKPSSARLSLKEKAMHWYLGVWKKYAVLKGRARRQEFWMFVLFNLITVMVLSLIDNAAGMVDPKSGYGLLGMIYILAVFIPGLAVGVRRLHDTGLSGWWFFIPMVPLIGGIALIVLMARDSQQGQNQYGPNPKEVAS